MKTLGELSRFAVYGIVTTDRDGDLGCGAIFWPKAELKKNGLLNEAITVVTENEDPEAWSLMRQAIDALRGNRDALQIVAVGKAPKNSLDVQTIYGATLRHEGVS
jgi:hypothetical protein